MKSFILAFLICSASVYALEQAELETRIKDQLAELGNQLVNTLTVTVNTIFNTINQAFGKRDLLEKTELEARIKDQLSELGNQLVNTLTVTVNTIFNAINQAFGKRDLLAKADIDIIQILGISEILENIKEIFGEVSASLIPVYMKLVKLWEDLKPVLLSLIPKFQLFIGEALAIIANFGVKLGEAILSYVNENLDHLLGLFQDAVKYILQFFHLSANGVQSGVNEYLINIFDLKQSWPIIQSNLELNFISKFQAALSQTLFTSEATWTSAKQMLAKLNTDIKATPKNVKDLSIKALSDLNIILSKD